MKYALFLLPCLMFSACVYNQHSYERSSGAVVSQEQVATIEVGKTTKQMLLTQLGVPDRVQQDSDGVEVFEYVNERILKTEKSFIFLFNIDSDKVVSTNTTRVIMRNGIVSSVNAIKK